MLRLYAVFIQYVSNLTDTFYGGDVIVLNASANTGALGFSSLENPAMLYLSNEQSSSCIIFFEYFPYFYIILNDISLFGYLTEELISMVSK